MILTHGTQHFWTLQDGEIAILVRDDSLDARSWLLLLPTDDLPFAPVGNTLVDKEPMALLALCLETVSAARSFVRLVFISGLLWKDLVIGGPVWRL